MIQYPRTLKNNIYHFKEMGTTTISSSGYQPCNWPRLVHSVDKTHVLVVTVNLIWLLLLDILSFNSPTTPRKILRFTRFIRSCINCPAVVLTNHWQSYTAFLLDVRCSKLPCSIFLQLFVPNDNAFALLSTPIAQML